MPTDGRAGRRLSEAVGWTLIPVEGHRKDFATPPALNEPGFLEDFFEGQRDAVTTFWHAVNQRLALVGATA